MRILGTHSFRRSLTLSTLFLGSALLLAACGGGSSPTPAPLAAPPPPPVVSSAPTWTEDVFQAESSFKNRCAAPRTGTNPATGQPYLDVAGSTLHEKHWQRSWSNDTYLWYSEIEDIDPATIADRLDYFEILKTDATTASGNARDRFHFTIDTAEHQQRVSSGASAGYGARFTLIRSAPPRDIRIAYVEAGSPATTAPANLDRGAVILEIDGVDVINGSDTNTLNAGLFPDGAGEDHTFRVRDLDGTERTFTMTSAIVTSDPVNVAKTIDVGGDRIGYLHFTTFGTTSAEQALFDAMTTFQADGITDLVLDLRYNGGGFLAIAGELGYMIAGNTQTNGRIFDKLTFNDKHPTVDPVTGRTLSPTPFYSTARGFSVGTGTALPTVSLNRVFILSTARTCSASEAVINGLRGVDVEVVLIGTTTCGKPYGFYATDNCGVTYFTIQFRGENDKTFGDYADGFTPIDAAVNSGELIAGCEVGDDFTKVMGDETEALFSTALSYRETGACPVVAMKTPGEASNKANAAFVSDDPLSLYNDPRVRGRLLLEQSLILSAPPVSKGE